ncbi:hypothetical protein [Selenomonas sp. AB3002]|jgi:hypothetical protein|uniref:hypothetical protein n=1 Tax=Selenomonas sp. AB3002 TaxID=1392502 RepID=UPI00049563A5
MVFEGIPNYYHEDKVTRIVGDGILQEWYGTIKTEEGGLACSKCHEAYKAKTVFAIHGEERQTLVYRCECGNYRISITHKPDTDPLR